MRDERSDKERDREGRYNHKACRHQDCKPTEVDHEADGHWVLGIASMKAAFGLRAFANGLCICMIYFLYNFLAMYIS